METFEEAMAHYGVKGMHWGVRKAVEAVTPSADAKAASKIHTKAKIGGVSNLSNKEIQAAITRMNLERQYKEIRGDNSLKSQATKWLANFLKDVAKDVLLSYVRAPRKNAASGGSYAYAYAGGKVIGRTVRAISR